jgi:aspartate/methionine/tyrosine aminotransferase
MDKLSHFLVMDILREARVAVAPGVDFGSHRTERCIRLAYTRDLDTLREG